MGERPLLGEVLVQSGLIDELQLARALGEQKRWGGRLGLALLRLGFVTEDELLRTLSNQLGVPAVRLGTKRVSSEVLDLLSAELAEKYRCVPLFVKQDAGRELLHLGMEDPTDLAAIDDVSFRTGRRVRPVLIGPDELRRCLARFYREGDPGECEEEDLPGSEEPPAQASASEPPESREALPPPDDPTIVAATAVVSESLAPPPEGEFESEEEADPDFVPEETLAQGMDSAAEESGATTTFGRTALVSSPDWADEEDAVASPPDWADEEDAVASPPDWADEEDAVAEPPEAPSPVMTDSAWTDAEPMSETDLPSASSSSALLEELDPGDSLDIEVGDDVAQTASPESEASEPAPEPEAISSRHLSHPESSPLVIPPEDLHESGMLLPLEEEQAEEEPADLAPPETDASIEAPEIESVEETLVDEASLILADLEPESLDASDSEAATPEPDEISLEAEASVQDAEAGLGSEDSDDTLASEPEPALAPEVEPLAAKEAHAEPPAISTRDVLRALTELLVEKGILEPSELLERVRAARAGDDPS